MDAAGHGWFVDATPDEDSEFTVHSGDGELVANPSSLAYGDMDLLTTVMHELGHVFGFEDLNPETDPYDLMGATLDTGERHIPSNNGSGQSHDSSRNLAAVDLTLDEADAEDAMDTLINENPWLIKYSPNRTGEYDTNLNDDTEGSSDPVGDPQGGPAGKKGNRNSK